MAIVHNHNVPDALKKETRLLVAELKRCLFAGVKRLQQVGGRTYNRLHLSVFIGNPYGDAANDMLELHVCVSQPAGGGHNGADVLNLFYRVGWHDKPTVNGNLGILLEPTPLELEDAKGSGARAVKDSPMAAGLVVLCNFRRHVGSIHEALEGYMKAVQAGGFTNVCATAWTNYWEGEDGDKETCEDCVCGDCEE